MPAHLNALSIHRLAELAEARGLKHCTRLSRPDLIRELMRTPLTESDLVPTEDWIEAESEDPYWIEARWYLGPTTTARLQQILRMAGPQGKLVIRNWMLSDPEGGPPSRTRASEVAIPRDAERWHIPIERPGRVFQLEFGYCVRGEFHSLLHSIPVQALNSRERNGFIEESNGATGHSHENRHKELKRFGIVIETDLLVHGVTSPTATVRINDAPVPVDPQGRFQVQFPLTDGRTLLPVVCLSGDGAEQQMIALAVERHARHIEGATPRERKAR